ncbi:MAG: hypothetical protein IT433_05425 [Phycisphaerales bacterium]|nr:hypothetical protein [Phycisphaerales bacterium]
MDSSRKPKNPCTRRKPRASDSTGPGPAPTTPDELHAWLIRELGLRMPRRAITEGHASPFDYLCWAFFGPDAESKTPAECGQNRPVCDAVIWANRGGGKTFLGAVATALDLIFLGGVHIRVLGGSLQQSQRMYAHLRRLFDPAQHPGLASMIRGRTTERRLTLSNGSEVELLAQSQTSVRGTRVQKIRCDEVDLFAPDVWEAVQLATRSAQVKLPDGSTRTVRGSIECLSTMHVPHGVMHALVQEAREGRRRLFRWGVIDVLGHCGGEHACAEGTDAPCPLWDECRGRAKKRSEQHAGHVTIDDAIALKRRVSLPVWETEMLTRRPRRSHAVFPEFARATHVVGEAGREPDADAELRAGAVLWAAGMDFGMRGATAVLWGALDRRGVLWILDERHLEGVILSEHVAAMQGGLQKPGVPAWPRPAWVAIDPSGRSVDGQTGLSAHEVLKRADLRPVCSNEGVSAGIAQVRARLSPASGDSPRLYVHARCVKLIEALERYGYPKHDPLTEKPEKGQFDHAADALRYLVRHLDRPRPQAASGMYT